MNTTRTLTALTAAITSVVLLSSCSVDDLRSEHVEDVRAGTGSVAKSNDIAPSWLPDDAQDVRVRRRTTGNERILVASYSRPLTATACVPIRSIGAPTTDELTRAYAADDITADTPVDDFTDEPTLTADWWPTGQDEKTTVLCDRWWVSSDNGSVYAWSPELRSVAADPRAQ